MSLERGNTMKTQKKRKSSKMLKAVHEMAHGLYDAHIIDATILREFEILCLPPLKKLSRKQRIDNQLKVNLK